MTGTDKLVLAVMFIALVINVVAIRIKQNSIQNNNQEHFLLIEKHLGIVK